MTEVKTLSKVSFFKGIGLELDDTSAFWAKKLTGFALMCK